MTPAGQPLPVAARASRMPLSDGSAATKPVSLRLTEIDVPAPLLAYHATRTVEIARLIRAGKPIAPLAVAERNGRYVLVAGKDEFAALKLVGIEMAEARIVDMAIGWRRKEQQLWKRNPR
jgi:hypothetical protein